MAHLHLIHRSIRLVDNTSLITQLKQMEQAVTPVFIFTLEQIDSKKNEFFTNGSVQFMIESLHELSQEIKKKKGKQISKQLIGDNYNSCFSVKHRNKNKKKGASSKYIWSPNKKSFYLKKRCEKNKSCWGK